MTDRAGCDGAVKGRSCVREQNHIGPHAASQAFADTLDAQQWWLCPNEPRCPHGRVLHDDDGPESTPTCCADGCDCGRAVEHDLVRFGMTGPTFPRGMDEAL